MKFLTSKGELKEGRPVTEAEVVFLEAIENSEMGGKYNVTTERMRDYILTHFVLTLREPEPVAPADDLVQPFEYPEPKSLPVVEAPEDGPSF